MHLFEQQQFEFLFQTAVERFVERSEQRFQGAENAIRLWKEDPASAGLYLDQFCDAVFEEFLLKNVDGPVLSCGVGETAVGRSTEGTVPHESTVGSHLIQLAMCLFGRLLYHKSLETLELHCNYQAIHSGDRSCVGTQPEFRCNQYSLADSR